MAEENPSLVIETYQLLAAAAALREFRPVEVASYADLDLAFTEDILKNYAEFWKIRGDRFVVIDRKEEALNQTIMSLYLSVPESLRLEALHEDIRPTSEVLDEVDEALATFQYCTNPKTRELTLKAASIRLNSVQWMLRPLTECMGNSDEIRELQTRFNTLGYLAARLRVSEMESRQYDLWSVKERFQLFTAQAASRWLENASGNFRFRDRPSLPWEADTRVKPYKVVECIGMDDVINRGFRYIQSGKGGSTVVMEGTFGVGKTTVAQATANRLVASGSGYKMSTVQILSCAGLKSFDEISWLLASQSTPNRFAGLPESAQRRINWVCTRAESSFDRHLIILDDLDAYLENRSTDLDAARSGAQLLPLLSRSKFDIIVTTTARLTEERRKAIFGGRSIKLSVKETASHQLGERVVELPISRGKRENPLALNIVSAAIKAKGADKLAEVSLEDTSNPLTDLPTALRFTWPILEDEQKHLLVFLAHLPGGVWHLPSDRPEGLGLIPWEGLFRTKSWLQQLNFFDELNIVQKDPVNNWTGEALVYTLRPGLREFVISQAEREKRPSCTRLLILFWARALRFWSKTIAGRHTDKASPSWGNTSQTNILTAELIARFLIDATRLNWLESFESIALYKPERRGRLYVNYLRGVICYCRMMGRQQFFKELVSEALARLEDEQTGIHATSRLACLATCYGMKGRTHRRLGEWEDAQKSLITSITLLRLLPRTGRVSAELGWGLTEVGRVAHTIGDWGAAEGYFKESLDTREQTLEKSKKRLLGAEDAIKTGGRVSAALALQVRLDERSLASTLNAFGAFLNERLDWYNAEALIQRSLSLRERVKTDSLYLRRYVAQCHNDLGNSYYYQGRLHEALDAYQRALETRLELVDNNPNTVLGHYVARTYNNLGNCYRRLGSWARAEESLDKAIAIYRTCVVELESKFDDLLARSLCNLGRVYFHQGRLQEALEVLNESVEYHSKAKPHRKVGFKWIEALHFLACVQMKLRQFEVVSSTIAQAKKLLENNRGTCGRNTLYYEAQLLKLEAQAVMTIPGYSKAPDRKQADNAFGLLSMSSECFRALTHLIPSGEKGASAEQVIDLYLAQNLYNAGLIFFESSPSHAQLHFERLIQEYQACLAASERVTGRRLLARTFYMLGMVLLEDPLASAKHLTEAQRFFRECRNSGQTDFSHEINTIENLLESRFSAICAADQLVYF